MWCAKCQLHHWLLFKSSLELFCLPLQNGFPMRILSHTNSCLQQTCPQADEAQLEVDQARKEQQQSKRRKEVKSKRKAEHIPTQNGEQDSMSICSGIVQVERQPSHISSFLNSCIERKSETIVL